EDLSNGKHPARPIPGTGSRGRGRLSPNREGLHKESAGNPGQDQSIATEMPETAGRVILVPSRAPPSRLSQGDGAAGRGSGSLSLVRCHWSVVLSPLLHGSTPRQLTTDNRQRTTDN